MEKKQANESSISSGPDCEGRRSVTRVPRELAARIFEALRDEPGRYIDADDFLIRALRSELDRVEIRRELRRRREVGA